MHVHVYVAMYAKQKHPECKNVQGQLKIALQTGSFGTNRLQVQCQTHVTRTKITRGYVCTREATRVVWLHVYALRISFMSSFL